jgi:hypothetical protein
MRTSGLSGAAHLRASSLAVVAGIGRGTFLKNSRRRTVLLLVLAALERSFMIGFDSLPQDLTRTDLAARLATPGSDGPLP